MNSRTTSQRVNLKPWHLITLSLCAGVAGFGCLAWKCLRDPEINFLPTDSRAEWIIFPTPVQAGAHRIAMLDTVFRKQFSIDGSPKSAQLQLRAARRAELKINGKSVEIQTSKNWKHLATTDVLPFLQSGSNTVEAHVFNDDAPPALWLRLSTDNLQLRSDNSWQASFTGSSWRPAALAADSKFPHAGNLLAGGEKTFAAKRRRQHTIPKGMTRRARVEWIQGISVDLWNFPRSVREKPAI